MIGNNLILNYVAPSTMKRIKDIGAKASETDFIQHVEKHQHVMSQIRCDNINVHADITRVASYFTQTGQFDPSSVQCAKTIPNVLHTYDTSNVDANGVLIESFEIIDKQFQSLHLIEQHVARKNSNAVSQACDDYKSILLEPVNEPLLRFAKPYLKRDAGAEVPLNFDDTITSAVVDLLSVEHYQTICRIVQMSDVNEQAVWLVSEHRMFVILGFKMFVVMSYASVNTGFFTGVLSKIEAKLYTKCSTPSFKMFKHAITYRYHYVAAAVLGASFTKYLAPSLISNFLGGFKVPAGLSPSQKLLSHPIFANILGVSELGATAVGLIKQKVLAGLFMTEIEGAKKLGTELIKYIAKK